MEQKQDFFPTDGDTDATLVTPRFDDVEAETARPVVPFAEVPDVESSHGASPVYGVTGAPKRRSWTLALIVVSALVGTLLGGAGLRLYQQRQRTAPATVAAEPTTLAEVETAQPSPAEPLVEESQTATALLEPVSATVVSATIVGDPGGAESSPVAKSKKDDDDDDEKKRAEAVEPRKSAEKERDEERKRKEDDDDDGRQGAGKTPRARRVDVLTGPPRAVGTQVGQAAEPEPEPQQIDREPNDFNERRQRRREQRERRARQRDVDRVRGIFEGQP